MRKDVLIIFLLCLVLICGTMLFPYQARGQLPFGGPITSLFYCLNGIGITVGPPVGGQFFYQPGASRSYLYGPPSHPGQYLLGVWGGYITCLVPCEAGACPDPSHSGRMILFHGSSQ